MRQDTPAIFDVYGNTVIELGMRFYRSVGGGRGIRVGIRKKWAGAVLFPTCDDVHRFLVITIVVDIICIGVDLRV